MTAEPRLQGASATSVAENSSAPSAGSARLAQKVLVACTEDWFTLSHFKPLLRRLCKLANEVVVVTRSSGRMGEIESIGCRTIALDYGRSSMNPAREARTVRRLAAILKAEAPDVVHLIAMKPIVLGGLATSWAPPRHTVIHMTGLGFLAISDSMKARAARLVALRVIRSVLRRSGSWLLVENPEDLAFLEQDVQTGGRVSLLGGAGIDPSEFTPPDQRRRGLPIAAYVARMIRPKGVDVLMDAAHMLAQRNVPLIVELHGDTDDDNPEAVPSDMLARWANGDDRRYLGFTRDVAAIWQKADIFVLPARSREGMPRALLEAAACARAVVVTDVPGCRHFVRDGVDGLIVPPGDAAALAAALERLAGDAALRTSLGHAARERVLSGYTEAHVEAGIEQAYRAMMGHASAG